jgi:ABC-type polysaccharide/polyol phosphate export permease
MSLAVLDLRKRYRRSALGLGWSVLQPLAMAAVIGGVFVGAMGVDFAQHFPFVLVGLCVWSFTSSVVRDGCGSIFWSETYIRQQRAPLAIYPLRIVLASAMHLSVAIAPVLVWSAAVGGFESMPALALLPLAFALLVVLGWGLAIVVSIVTVYVPDASQVLEIVLQLAFYATPIIYNPALLRDRGCGWAVDLNPAAALVDVFRQPLLLGQFPSWSAVLLVAAATAVVWAGAGVLLSKFERTIIFRL